MKLCFFHLMPYTDLPADFADTHPGVWVDVDSRLFDPEKAHLSPKDTARFLGEDRKH